MADQDNGDFLPPDIGALAQEQRAHDEAAGATTVGKVIAAHHDELMDRPGVNMIGETLDMTGRPAILIGVKSAKALKGLPKSIDGIPVVTQVIGEIDAQ